MNTYVSICTEVCVCEGGRLKREEPGEAWEGRRIEVTKGENKRGGEGTRDKGLGEDWKKEEKRGRDGARERGRREREREREEGRFGECEMRGGGKGR